MDEDDERKCQLSTDQSASGLSRSAVHPSGGAHVEIVDATGSLNAECVSWLRDRAEAASKLVGAFGATGEVRVRIIDDAAMAEAHARHCGLDSTTDVLTFDLRERLKVATNHNRLDTDVLVCLDEARRQGADRGHATERELLLYIVHAMLHCLGFNDHDDGEYARMHAEEDRVLEQIGIGRTFNADARAEESAC